jgi:hypothetical protein
MLPASLPLNKPVYKSRYRFSVSDRPKIVVANVTRIALAQPPPDFGGGIIIQGGIMGGCGGG